MYQYVLLPYFCQDSWSWCRTDFIFTCFFSVFRSILFLFSIVDWLANVDFYEYNGVRV